MQKNIIKKDGQVGTALLYGKRRRGCVNVKFEFNNIISLYTRNDFERDGHWPRILL